MVRGNGRQGYGSHKPSLKGRPQTRMRMPMNGRQVCLLLLVGKRGENRMEREKTIERFFMSILT